MFISSLRYEVAWCFLIQRSVTADVETELGLGLGLALHELEVDVTSTSSSCNANPSPNRNPNPTHVRYKTFHSHKNPHMLNKINRLSYNGAILCYAYSWLVARQVMFVAVSRMNILITARSFPIFRAEVDPAFLRSLVGSPLFRMSVNVSSGR